jgi:hypothetical protein
MRLIGRGLLVGAFVLGAAHATFAKCGDEPGDAAAVLAARQAAESTCDCANAINHGTFVKCVAGVANDRAAADPPLLPKNCKGAVKKCAARSTCGKPGAVTCCITNPNTLETKCKIKKDVAHCDAKGGDSSSPCTSCCDACPAPGSGPSCGGGSPSGAFVR